LIINQVEENMDKIILRALTKEDAKKSWLWRNYEEIRYFYSGHPFYVNQEKEEEWILNISKSDLPLVSFGIVEIETQTLIGMAFLKDVNLIHRRAEYAFFIGDESAKGKGHAKEVTKKIIYFAFSNLNINRLFLKVQEDNSKAIKLYESLSFKMEGLLRESVFKNGRYLNELVYSVLKSEYLDQNKL